MIEPIFIDSSLDPNRIVQIMETYAFLPREAVTAFLMGCPQCSTNNAGGIANAGCATTVENPQQPPQLEPQPPPPSVPGPGFCHVSVEQSPSLSSFTCSTPVKQEVSTENCTKVGMDSAVVDGTVDVVAGSVANKENVTDNAGHTMTTRNNKRKRTVPTKRGQQPSEDTVVAVVGNTSTGSSTLKNSSNCSSSNTLLLSSSSSSSKTDHSGASRLSGWWSRGMCSRLSASAGGISDLSAVNNVPLDLSSSSPLSAVSPVPTARSSSPSVAEDFFYRRRCVRRRRLRPKRLSRSCRGRRIHYEDDDTSASDVDRCRDSGNKVVLDNQSSNSSVSGGVDEGVVSIKDARDEGNRIRDVEIDEEDDGPRPAKVKKTLDRESRGYCYSRNNNDDDYYDKATVTAKSHCDMDSDHVTVDTTDMVIKESAVEANTTVTAVESEKCVENSSVEDFDENQVSEYLNMYFKIFLLTLYTYEVTYRRRYINY